MQEKKDLNKLTSVDEYGSHISLIPGEVRGFFKTRRTWVHAFLLLVFLLLPWIHVNGQQLILLNISSREFRFFGMLFRSHDAPLIFFLVMAFVLGLAFVTAIWGRVWCGWACPQTVFVDAVYRRIELWTEGNYIQRRLLRSKPWTIDKIRKVGFKWVLFILVSSLISHSFIAYFTGSIELVKMMKLPPTENWTYFVLVISFTLVLLFNFAWFREQFCVIMCPYGRIQSVLLEPTSISVVYDEKRGEPRRSPLNKGTNGGDCVSCNRCVEVCPTGIDIRNGLQMECIACTACMDACDEIMEKVKKPKGLIGYKTLNGLPFKMFTLKTAVYGLLILFSIGGLAYSLKTREPVNISVLRAIESPYSFSKDEMDQNQVLNHFRLHLINQTDQNVSYRVSISEKDQELGMKLIMSQNPFLIDANKSETTHIFIQFNQNLLAADGQLKTKIFLTDLENKKIEKEVILLGPRK
jgi:cytochrome c oxidase accessory protein FixG